MRRSEELVKQFRNSSAEREFPTPTRGSFEANRYNTTDLTRNVMATCASHLGLDIDDDTVSDELYEICCGLEDYPEDHGFGSSDHYSYIESARAAFGK